MPKKPKSNSPPRSLFKDVPTLVPVPGTFRSYADMLDTWKSVAALQSRCVERDIERIEAAAARASTDPRLERGADFAATITSELKALEAARASASNLIVQAIEAGAAAAARVSTDPRLERGAEFFAARASRKIDAAIGHAMKAVETWMMLRADAMFGPAVRSRERSDANVGRSTQVTRAQAAAALQEHDSKTAAAEALGISRPTLDTLLPDD
jgi:hypothetical protein